MNQTAATEAEGRDDSSASGLSHLIKTAAQELGWDLVGIAPAVTPEGLHRFLDWLERDYAGEMHYMSRRAEAYSHPKHVLAGVRSVVMLGMHYAPEVTGQQPPETSVESAVPAAVGDPAVASAIVPARVARYASGSADYHDMLRERLRQLATAVKRVAPTCKTRGVVDTAPLLERDFARLAGLGWFGKNTMLINRRRGSWFFLAALLIDQELAYDNPHTSSHCGTCTRCLEVCPTDAFVAPYVLDARRCISYLTIEHRGPIAVELRPQMGDWLFGCDVCQEVCPWNRFAPPPTEPAFQPGLVGSALDATTFLQIDDEEFGRRFGHTPLARPGRAGLARNAAIVLGNSGQRAAVPVLTKALEDSSEIVREAAAWALERIRTNGLDPLP
ncbi:MAG: tRNA epoxyqueuosine(34) reductase QueG [Planctomycetes bacterium]|nr:tRNA epoxyqueuosine(34) reductase QueG [Planctomycetota bacterium]